MKTINWILGLAVVALLGLSACSKEAPPPQYLEINGVKVELPKLEEAYATASDEQRATVSQVSSALRYGQHDQALMGLDKLANDPSATEPQKKVANALIEQMKQVISKAPAPAAQ